MLVCLSALFTACNTSDVVTIEKEDTSKMYTDAKTSTESLKQLETIKTVERTFSGDGGSFSDKTVSDIKRSTDKNGHPIFLKTFQKTMISEDNAETYQESSAYCIDNMVYEKDLEGKRTCYLAKDTIIKERFKSVIPTIPADALANSTVYEGSDITQIVSTTDATNVHSLLYSLIGGINEYYSPVAGNDSFVFEYSSISISFDISGEYFKKISITFDAKFCHKDGSSNITTEVTWDVIDPGSDVSFEAPTDLNEYVLLDDSTSEEPADILAAVDSLFGERGEPIDNYDALYNEYSAEFGKETLDRAIEEYLKQLNGIG